MDQVPREPSEQLIFDPIKEHRGPYFVSYRPPEGGNNFAMLSLTFLDAIELSEATDFMKLELERWLARYPVPLMASAFDSSDGMLPLRSGLDQLVGWIDPNTGKVTVSWNLDDLTAHLNASSFTRTWPSIYSDVPFRTLADIRAKAREEGLEFAKGAAILRLAVIFWAVILPAGIAAFGYFGPEWLGLVGLILSWWKAWRTWCQLTGRIKPSPSDKEKSDKALKMAHYFYHCELNPEGFARLRAENSDREARDRTLKEAAELADATTKRGKPLS